MIPSDAPAGNAQIAIARFFLIGVSQVWHIMTLKPHLTSPLNVLGWEFPYNRRGQCDGRRTTVRPDLERNWIV